MGQWLSILMIILEAHGLMQELKTFYSDTTQRIDIATIKSNALNKHFNLKGNNIVAFKNSFNLDTLCFIFDCKNTQHTIKHLSKLFLLSINQYTKLFDINEFSLTLNKVHFQHTVFTRQLKRNFYSFNCFRSVKKSKVVTHSNIAAKDFSISVLNEFKKAIL